MSAAVEWTPVVCAADLPECECCGEPFCPVHDCHFADCACIGPTEDGVEYSEDAAGNPVARRLT